MTSGDVDEHEELQEGACCILVSQSPRPSKILCLEGQGSEVPGVCLSSSKSSSLGIVLPPLVAPVVPRVGSFLLHVPAADLSSPWLCDHPQHVG